MYRKGKIEHYSSLRFAWWRMRWDSVFLVTGIVLILCGIIGEFSLGRLWYCFDFRLWGWWLFGVVVVGGFWVVRRMGGKIAIVGVLFLGVILVVRANFDFRTYVEGNAVTVRVGEAGVFDYKMYLPKGFHDLGAKRPLIVFLHGAGTTDIDALHGWNLASFMEGEFPFIVVAPVAPKHHGWKPDRLVGFIDELVGQVGGRLNIDLDRVYLTGYSMGGFGTFQTACAYPDRFAAIVPLAGGGDPEKADALQGVPTWAFHGDADTCVGYRYTARMIERMRELKHPNVKFTTFKGCGHGGVDQAAYSQPELYRWLLEQKKEQP